MQSIAELKEEWRSVTKEYAVIIGDLKTQIRDAYNERNQKLGILERMIAQHPNVAKNVRRIKHVSKIHH